MYKFLISIVLFNLSATAFSAIVTCDLTGNAKNQTPGIGAGAVIPISSSIWLFGSGPPGLIG